MMHHSLGQNVESSCSSRAFVAGSLIARLRRDYRLRGVACFFKGGTKYGKMMGKCNFPKIKYNQIIWQIWVSTISWGAQFVSFDPYKCEFGVWSYLTGTRAPKVEKSSGTTEHGFTWFYSCTIVPPLKTLKERTVTWNLQTSDDIWCFVSDMGLSENSVPLHPMVNDHYPY